MRGFLDLQDIYIDIRATSTKDIPELKNKDMVSIEELLNLLDYYKMQYESKCLEFEEFKEMLESEKDEEIY